MSDIEFVPEESGDDGDTEELHSPTPRRPRKWWVIAGGLVAAAAIAVTAVVLLNRHHNPPQQQAAIGFVPRPQIREGVPSRLPVQRVLDVSVTDGQLWQLEADKLVVTIGQKHVVLTPFDDMTDMRLVPDPHGHQMWLLGPGYADRIPTDLGFGNGLVPPVFSAAAALDGHLYLAHRKTLLDIGPPRYEPRVLARSALPIVALSADPTRHRLLMADSAARTHVTAVPVSGGQRVHHVVGIIKPELVVVNGAIWVAGFDNGAGPLVRLDPRTLAPRLASPEGEALLPGALLAGTGDQVFWVRSADNDNDQTLRCIDASTGRAAQLFLGGGDVASGRVGAYVTTRNGLQKLALNGCQG